MERTVVTAGQLHLVRQRALILAFEKRTLLKLHDGFPVLYFKAILTIMRSGWCAQLMTTET